MSLGDGAQNIEHGDHHSNRFKQHKGRRMRMTSTAYGSTLKTLSYTSLAMLAFAANSVLCRAALGQSLIDASSFTFVRIASGAVSLWVIWRFAHSTEKKLIIDWPSASMLFLYAVTFSFAYIMLETGTGALILFGLVQLTMISAGLWSGERPTGLAWTGMLVAIAGLVFLISPGLTAPSPLGAALMGVAGVAWGIYSLRGRRHQGPIAATTGNFLGAVPIALTVGLIFLPDLDASVDGLIMATVSGAITSGVGYVIWYAALPGLSPTKAANVQLSVPAIAASAGVLILSEPFTLRLVLASAMILGGIACVLSQRRQP